MTSNLPFEARTSVPGPERLTGVSLDRPTHRVGILSMNGDTYRLRSFRTRRGRSDGRAEQNQATAESHGPGTVGILPA